MSKYCNISSRQRFALAFFAIFAALFLGFSAIAFTALSIEQAEKTRQLELQVELQKLRKARE